MFRLETEYICRPRLYGCPRYLNEKRKKIGGLGSFVSKNLNLKENDGVAVGVQRGCRGDLAWVVCHALADPRM